MGTGKPLHGQELADAMKRAAMARSDGDAGLLAWGAAEIERLLVAVKYLYETPVSRGMPDDIRATIKALGL